VSKLKVHLVRVISDNSVSVYVLSGVDKVASTIFVSESDLTDTDFVDFSHIDRDVSVTNRRDSVEVVTFARHPVLESIVSPLTRLRLSNSLAGEYGTRRFIHKCPYIKGID
jgi:hypothetical protein